MYQEKMQVIYIYGDGTQDELSPVPQGDGWEVLSSERRTVEDYLGIPFDVLETTYRRRRPILLVGRHDPSMLPDSVVVQETANVTFALDLNTCMEQVKSLIQRAEAFGGSVVFQATPGILAVALVYTTHDRNEPIGILISKQGEADRTANVTKAETFLSPGEADKAVALVQHANGRAKTSVDETTVMVTVDPVKPFVLDHIEWV